MDSGNSEWTTITAYRRQPITFVVSKEDNDIIRKIKV